MANKTILKFSMSLGDSCDITIQEKTGYKSLTNTEGFLTEAETLVSPDDYKLSHGYFRTVVLYNKYGMKPIIVNIKDTFKKIDNISSDYDDNFTPEIFNLSQDGVFTIRRIFVISEEHYNSYKNTNRFDNKVIYYTNGTIIYKVDDLGVITPVYLDDFINETDNFVGLNTLMKIVSTCFLNNCYYNLCKVIIAKGIEICSNSAYATMVKERDFIYMILEVIKYEKEIGNTSEIQKIIESSATCGGICKEVSTLNDCGCG